MAERRGPLFAVVQMSSQDDLSKNLTRARDLLAEARSMGAEVALLPENFAFMGSEEDKRTIAEALDGTGAIVSALKAAAKELGLTVIAGGMPERSTDPDRPFNTS